MVRSRHWKRTPNLAEHPKSDTKDLKPEILIQRTMHQVRKSLSQRNKNLFALKQLILRFWIRESSQLPKGSEQKWKDRVEDFCGALKRGPRGENSGATPRQEAVERPKTVLGNFVVNNLRQGEVEGRRYTVLDGPQLLLNVAHVNLSCFIQRLYASTRTFTNSVKSAIMFSPRPRIRNQRSRFTLDFALPFHAARPTSAGTRRGKRNSNSPLGQNSNSSAPQISKLHRLNSVNNVSFHSVYARVRTFSFKRRRQRAVKKKRREKRTSSKLLSLRPAVVRGNNTRGNYVSRR